MMRAEGERSSSQAPRQRRVAGDEAVGKTSQTRPIAGPGQPPRQRGVANDGPLHVAHVLHSLEVGGTENGVVNLVTRLGGVRHSVIAMTTAGPLAARWSSR